MAGYTPYFGLAFFNVGDDGSDLANVQKEMERFVVIDKQLYGLYSVFGNGVISGWTVVVPTNQNPRSITVNISAGLGIINLLACETLYQARVIELPANRTIYIYVQIV